MKFYFCETCGKRINDGEVRNKGLKGWYCGDCAPGVMTVEMTALSIEQAKRALQKARATPAAPSAPVAVKPALAERTPAASESAKLKLSVAFLAGAVAIACVIVFAAMKGGKPPDTPVVAATTPAPPNPIPAPAPMQPAPTPARPPDTPAPDAERKPSVAPALQGEAAAERAFDELEKSLRAMSTAGNEEKMDVIERYLETYNESIVASRARLLLANFRQPELPPVAPPAKADPRVSDPASSPADDAIKADLLQRLKAANPQFEGVEITVEKGGKISTLVLSYKSISDISPLKGLDLSYLALHKTKVADLTPLSEMKISYLGLQQCPVASLKPLAAMSLARLDITHTPIDDISALNVSRLIALDAGYSGLKEISALKNAKLLTRLDLSSTAVSDLSPLKGLPLTHLDINATKVTDISVLAGMPLEYLRVGACDVKDFSVIKTLPLKSIGLSWAATRHAAMLKSMPTLKTINSKPIEQFWQEQDSKKK
jgi:internalin A